MNLNNAKLFAVGIASAIAGGIFTWGISQIDVHAASSEMKMVVTGTDGMVKRYEDTEYKIVCYVFGEGFGAGCAKK